MTVSWNQLCELRRLVSGMVFDALDAHLYRIERKCRDYLAMKPKGGK